LFLLIFAFIELGMIFFTYSVIEGATSIGSRTGKTGYPSYNRGISRVDYIRNRIQALSLGTINNSRLVITMLAYRDFSNIGQPEPCIPVTDPPPCPNGYNDINENGVWDADQGRADAGGSGEVVVYKVVYKWPILTPIMRQLLGDAGGVFFIESVATVRNEQFS
jgi:hypothetical protein